MTHREHVEEMVKIALFEHVGLLTKEAMTGNIAASATKAVSRLSKPAMSSQKGWLHSLFAPKPQSANRLIYRQRGPNAPVNTYSLGRPSLA